MIDGQHFIDQPVKNDLRTYDNIEKITSGHCNYLLDYHYFQEHCKLIAIHLSKQQALDPDPKKNT